MDKNKDKITYVTDGRDFIPDNFVVNALVYDSKDRVLLLKRKDNHTYYPKYWSVVMEKVKEGETFDEALYRGIREELGILISGEKVRKMEEDLKKVWKGKKYLIRRYFVEGDEEELFLNSEHDKCIWLEKDSDKDIDIMPDSLEMIQQFYSR